MQGQHGWFLSPLCRPAAWQQGSGERKGKHLGGSHQDLPVLGRAQVVHHAHELGGLRSGLLGLGHVHVHFVPVKVGVVGAADALVEAEGPAPQNSLHVVVHRHTRLCSDLQTWKGLHAGKTGRCCMLRLLMLGGQA